MRRYHKQKAKKLIDSLIKAHEMIETQIKSGDIEAASALIGKCQQAAISIGTMIEESDADGGAVAVKELENYCEKLYEIHQHMQEQNFDFRKVESSLSKILRVTLDKIDKEIKTDYEVVFLPYKAAMWDSLESVWQKAAEDPNCHAVVVPIPYFDKNPDGSPKEVHYEIDQYPKSVPVVNFEKYDFELMHPDIVYIHNPYDGINFVTSVHPFFYSDNLKKYTDELIYIPYFVLGEPADPDDEEYIAINSHFFCVPGVFNADKVIVQSENMKRAYVNALTKLHGENTRKYWDSKIYGTGSPKLDKAKTLRAEDYEIPESWKNKIYKEDGSRKKIVLYNTGLTALLEQDEKMLDKIKYNLKVFKEAKDDVILLWRPHPLIEATLTSMRPQLWEDYNEIVKTYLAEDWGIFDDTADMDRAIAISDAYYGDRSSLVQLYEETQKPIMIQNVDIVDD